MSKIKRKDLDYLRLINHMVLDYALVFPCEASFERLMEEMTIAIIAAKLKNHPNLKLYLEGWNTLKKNRRRMMKRYHLQGADRNIIINTILLYNEDLAKFTNQEMIDAIKYYQNA